jgi:hypothetical protein
MTSIPHIIKMVAASMFLPISETPKIIQPMAEEKNPIAAAAV